uniref:Protein phosphatase 1, regulatory subunit 12C n=1 Tax=Neogobius melanostomus TaxID=47308 RepID=A0A8C6SLB1_9GOBI
MGDSATTKRQEQLKRWAGSCTDKASAVPGGGAGATSLPTVPDLLQVGGSNLGSLDETREVRPSGCVLAACASCDTEEAQVMLTEARLLNREDGPDVVNCSNADGITALHQACIDGSMEMVTFLLGNGACVNQVDQEGWTPLHVAASCGYPDIAEYLLQHDACLSAVNCDGDVPLDIALDETTESLLQKFTVKLGVDLEAAKRAEEEQIMRDARAWLTEGSPDNVRHAKTGATPLHVAAAKGYLEALKMLCQCGIDVSAKDNDGWTPLHAAAHWGQSEACQILAEQLCNMESRSNSGQTPFDVADESVEELLEELLQKQANWRKEQSILDRQNQQGSTTANAQSKRRRSSVCRMSSKEKMNVQDQSKERGVSGDVEFSEEKESSPESSAVSSPDTDSVPTSTVSPADKTPEENEEEEKEQDRANRTARVQPTPQTKDSPADSPNTPNSDRRKFQAIVRDEESESQRKARSRLLRQTRRSTQGVTLTDLKEAEKSVGKAADPAPPRTVQPVSPIITFTPAERDTDPVKEEEPEADKKLGVRDRRRGRKERRSTGIVQTGAEVRVFTGALRRKLGSILLGARNKKALYFKILQENLSLKDRLQEMELLLSQNKVELERLRQEKLSLQRKAIEMEDELKVILGDLKADNQRLKDENAALIRVISKLSR